MELLFLKGSQNLCFGSLELFSECLHESGLQLVEICDF